VLKGVLGLLALTALAGGWAVATSADLRPDTVTIYLQRDGARIDAGRDNAARGTSSSVRRAGLPHVEIPPFEGDDDTWNDLGRCVADVFADFDVEVVDERPAHGHSIMATVGGSPDQLGFADTVEGLAPYDGNLDDDTIVFVFQRPGDSVEELCMTTAHEVGHALGLDHTRDCDDIMSYENCGEKQFKDEPMLCGEWNARDCDGDEPSQNSYTRLADAIGRRSAEPAWKRTLAKVARRGARTALATVGCPTCAALPR
jgi:hypothetical protein